MPEFENGPSNTPKAEIKRNRATQPTNSNQPQPKQSTKFHSRATNALTPKFEQNSASNVKTGNQKKLKIRPNPTNKPNSNESNKSQKNEI